MRVPVWKPLYRLLRLFGYPVSWEISVGAVVFRDRARRREYLLLRYPSGHYDFARGHQEENETELGTLRRETEEETGIDDLRIFEKRIRVTFFYAARGEEREKRLRQKRGLWIFKEVLLYPALTKKEAVELSFEHTEFVWLPIEAALAKATYQNAKYALRETEQFLRESAGA
jgi:8-oxo-dGTP pyrophosphatase MutT (NUDIX family)